MRYGTGNYTYEPVAGWLKLPEGFVLGDAGAIHVDPADRVWVFSRRHLAVFDREGRFLNSWGQGFFERCHRGCVGPDGYVYIADDGNHTVSRLTREGDLKLTLGNKGRPSDTGYDRALGLGSIQRGGPPFNRPTGVAVSSSGEIYVSDGQGNARIHKFAPDGRLLLSWGEPGSALMQFKSPHGIWVDKSDRVWVADRKNNRIQIFSAEGEFIDQWTDLKEPQTGWIDDDGTVYVAEAFQRISIFTGEGELLARWGNEGIDDATALFSAPHSIAVDSQGDLYVGEVAESRLKIDRGSRVVQKFVRRSS